MAGGRPERYILTAALLLPLAIALGVAQVAGGQGMSPGRLMDAERTSPAHRPASSKPDPPPTLAPPASPTPSPRAGPETTVTATPVKGKQTYVVQPGDELRYIAAAYGVSVWKIIAINDVPNPDSLRVGQVLTIPER
jgi:LysM repeat protein